LFVQLDSLRAEKEKERVEYVGSLNSEKKALEDELVQLKAKLSRVENNVNELQEAFLEQETNIGFLQSINRQVNEQYLPTDILKA